MHIHTYSSQCRDAGRVKDKEIGTAVTTASRRFISPGSVFGRALTARRQSDGFLFFQLWSRSTKPGCWTPTCLPATPLCSTVGSPASSATSWLSPRGCKTTVSTSTLPPRVVSIVTPYSLVGQDGVAAFRIIVISISKFLDVVVMCQIFCRYFGFLVRIIR